MTSTADKPRLSRSTRCWLCVYIVWVAFMWGHSLVPGAESEAESDVFVSFLLPLFDALGITNATTMTLIVRKSAHFLGYAVLGVSAYMVFSKLHVERHLPRWAGVLAACVVPCIDETIQLFVPGREGMLADVLLDLAGVTTGALVAWTVIRSRRVAQK